MRSCFSRNARILRRAASAALLSATLTSSPSFAADRRSNDAVISQVRTINVNAVLVVASPVSRALIDGMQAEAARIWNPLGVQVLWQTPGRPIDSTTTVVVLVSPDATRCGPARAEGDVPLGCFLEPTGTAQALIVVLPNQVLRVVTSQVTQHRCQRCFEGSLDHLAGRLLGRTFAHELGHYLLGREHAATGLMRERFPHDELFSQEPDALVPTEAQLDLLADRVLTAERLRSRPSVRLRAPPTPPRP